MRMIGNLDFDIYFLVLVGGYGMVLWLVDSYKYKNEKQEALEKKAKTIGITTMSIAALLFLTQIFLR
ncbi:CLC_0170 family protein [Clostridium cellulovorans]|uniref:Uncharacterized protein n=1 Tax=Clostridium cellulovorans (strain ATCC 35296 / DSM 3052 / OCM 3 / 743B) TaxID=573061 RepID=D9STP9_CLOC7|nr:CLC_0170 family protein [Clostridium cellulovorans]ADL52783.1 hypothetical protein Clocel_3093 [Clostridium cellulovorans 743B]